MVRWSTYKGAVSGGRKKKGSSLKAWPKSEELMFIGIRRDSSESMEPLAEIVADCREDETRRFVC
jgi:hypothetical protein